MLRINWRVLFAACLVFVFSAGLAPADEPPGDRERQLEEVLQRLRQDRQNSYLQYAAIHLAGPLGRRGDVALAVQRITRERPSGLFRINRQVDAMSLFAGALAVQESLQLDTLLADSPAERGPSTVDVSSLQGPTVQSHPWSELLAGRKPEISALALRVPADQYFVLFHSPNKLLDAIQLSDLWGRHLFSQTANSAVSHLAADRIIAQLALPTDDLSRAFYDQVVGQVALTGNDLYFRSGNDVTVLFQLKVPAVFRARLDGESLQVADATAADGEYLGVRYRHVTTPKRRVHYYAAYPRPDLHVRSNSKAALFRVLRAIVGPNAENGQPIPRLGELDEYQYIRTLMPHGAAEEDGFIYLSDPFIRRIVGPEVKLTEYRRMHCYNHLRMIGHAAMLFRTQFGREPASLDELQQAGCTPARFGEGALACPMHGSYQLDNDQLSGLCTVHGEPRGMIPGIENPVERVTEPEAEAYGEFLEDYNQYWRVYFDPIAVRLQLSPDRYRAETIVLPLIDNSVYTGLATYLNGPTEALDQLPVPERNILTLSGRINKDPLLNSPSGTTASRFLNQLFGVAEPATPPSERELLQRQVTEFLREGLGNQVGFHVYDSETTFDFNFTGFLGEVAAVASRRQGQWGGEILPFAFLISSLNSPVYLSFSVQDANVVDRFLETLDGLLAQVPNGGGWLGVQQEFYRLTADGVQEDGMRAGTIQAGPFKLRFFWQRVGDGLYVTNKRYILQDLRRQREATAGDPTDPGPSAHAMLRLRPEHWKAVLPGYELGWEEARRAGCMKNLSRLEDALRGLATRSDSLPAPGQIARRAERLHGVWFYCPDGGQYQAASGDAMECSIHGGRRQPRQPHRPAALTEQTIGDMGRVTASLTFQPEGLHAELTLERRQQDKEARR